MTTGKSRRAALGLLALAALSARAACGGPQLGSEVLRRLIVMEDVEAVPVVAEQIEWLGQGGMIVGGWERWPDRPVLTCFDCPELRLSGQPRPLAFFPFFALSSQRTVLAYWRPAGQGAECELMAVNLRTGVGTPVGRPWTFVSAGRLVMLEEGTIVASCQPEGGGCMLIRVRPDGSSALLAEFRQQVCDGLVAEPGHTHVIARCVSDTAQYYRVQVADGAQTEVEAATYHLYAPQYLPAGVFLDGEGRLARRIGDGENVILVTEVAAACGHPRSGGIIYASSGRLWVVSADGSVQRQLVGALPPQGWAAHMIRWSPEGVHVAHCYERDYAGTVRRAALGTEDVKVKLVFPPESQVAVGKRLWVAEKFRFDDQGRLKEPVWATLKALLRVDQVAPSDQGLMAEASSEGTEAGVVERLTGSNEAPKSAPEGHIAIGAGSQPPTAWVQTFTVEPLAELRAWAEGDTVVGSLLSVAVTRRRLMALE